MSAWLADLIYRFRLPLSGAIIVGFLALLPLTNITDIDNDISMWISRDDPVYQTYERFRQEFGGQRTLLIALKSDDLFTRESLEFIRTITSDIERVRMVERVQSLATANIVRALPADSADEGGGIEVQPLLDEQLDTPELLDRVRRRALDDPLLRGPVPAPPGADLNDPDGLSPSEPTRIVENQH